MRYKVNLSHVFMEIGLHACICRPGLAIQVKLHCVAALKGEQGVKKAKYFFFMFMVLCSWQLCCDSSKQFK